jgi:hypothetical protein
MKKDRYDELVPGDMLIEDYDDKSIPCQNPVMYVFVISRSDSELVALDQESRIIRWSTRNDVENDDLTSFTEGGWKLVEFKPGKH